MFSRREAAKFLRVLPQKVTKIYCAQLYKDLCTFSIFMHQPKNFCAPLCTGRKKIVHWRKKLCTVHKKSLVWDWVSCRNWFIIVDRKEMKRFIYCIILKNSILYQMILQFHNYTKNYTENVMILILILKISNYTKFSIIILHLATLATVA